MNSGLYKITNTINNKYYIGSSSNLKRRFRDHKKNLEENKHSNKHLQASYNKYGKEAFIFEIIKFVSKEKLIEEEQALLNTLDFNKVYNQATRAEAGGSNVQRIPIYLLNLKGEIITKYNSMTEARHALNRSTLELKDCNNGRIILNMLTKTKHRAVTIDFYENNLDIIKSWPPYSNLVTYKQNLSYYYTIYSIEYDEDDYMYNNEILVKVKEFKHLHSCANFLKLSRERVRQIVNNEKGYYYKLNYRILKTLKDNNIY